MRAWIPTLLLIALTAAGCGSSDWERRVVSWEQAEAELTRLLGDAEPAAHVAEIEIGARDIWAVTADAVLTVHPDCALMTVGGRSSYRRAGMGVVEGLGVGSPLPAHVVRFSHRDWYGAPSRVQIGERRIVLLWLRPGDPHDVAAIAMEFVPESDGSADGPEVEWRRTVQIRVTYCYNSEGVELPNFDRSALPQLDLSGLDGHSRRCMRFGFGSAHTTNSRVRPTGHPTSIRRGSTRTRRSTAAWRRARNRRPRFCRRSATRVRSPTTSSSGTWIRAARYSRRSMIGGRAATCSARWWKCSGSDSMRTARRPGSRTTPAASSSARPTGLIRLFAGAAADPPVR